uniref:Uncharacterized protein LOC104235183 n=1 Tax=Nicotiana sylvestris TaxID=4096 RepID=A0A1U7XJQ7_NICSY|nr:PREDICTED: uncharacterized protein LOC104235183 [Nicotiana sylvestris]
MAPKDRKEYNDIDRKAVEKNYRAKKILALSNWGDSSSELEREPDAKNNSMMAVETEATKYDSLFVLMAQSDEDKEDEVAKGSLRYLKGTQDLVLYYPSGDGFNLVGYADVNYAGSLVDRKNTSGMVHLPCSCLISRGTRKQNSMASSTTKAECVAAAS